MYKNESKCLCPSSGSIMCIMHNYVNSGINHYSVFTLRLFKYRKTYPLHVSCTTKAMWKLDPCKLLGFFGVIWKLFTFPNLIQWPYLTTSRGESSCLLILLIFIKLTIMILSCKLYYDIIWITCEITYW